MLTNLTFTVSVKSENTSEILYKDQSDKLICGHSNSLIHTLPIKNPPCCRPELLLAIVVASK